MKHATLIRTASAVAIAACMVAAAELTGEREIVFPEIMALAVGALVAPKRSWQVSPARMVGLIALCSAGGVLVVRYVPLEPWAQVLLAFAACQIAFPLTRTSFAPMISAMVLPVLLGTGSWVYPVAATALTALVAGTRAALEKLGVCPREAYEPQPFPEKRDLPAIALRTALGGAWAAACVAGGVPFCAAPPLLVAFTELTRPACAARSHPERTVALVALCAAGGTALRLAAAGVPGLPLTVAAALASALALGLMHAMKRYLPPAGAMAVLPMLLPADRLALFPAQALAGILVLTALALTCFRAEREPARAAEPPAAAS